jgi:hypothetical protein
MVQSSESKLFSCVISQSEKNKYVNFCANALQDDYFFSPHRHRYRAINEHVDKIWLTG